MFCARAVGKHQIGIENVDLFGEVVDHLLLLVREVLHAQRIGLNLLLHGLFLGFLSERFLSRRSCLSVFLAKGIQSELDFVRHWDFLL